MINFCTLFDSNYLSRGLTMYQSLVDTGEDFHLYVFCFDDKVFSVLDRMDLPFIISISLRDFESEDLLRVKNGRTRAEYCWTCASHSIAYALNTFHLDSVTYLDADMYFYARPSILLEEFERSESSVLLCGHNFSPRYEDLVKAGIYCVQFMTFKADKHGMTALRWWQDRCLEWCYDRFEKGRFGDQKYLDDWPERFEGVHVLQHPGGGVAPWNVQRYAVSRKNGMVYGKMRETSEPFAIIFYHFHHVRLYTELWIEMGYYLLDDAVKRDLYLPYLDQLHKAGKRICAVDDSFDPHGKTPLPGGLIKMLGRLYRRLRGNYNIWRWMEEI